VTVAFRKRRKKKEKKRKKERKKERREEKRKKKEGKKGKKTSGIGSLDYLQPGRVMTREESRIINLEGRRGKGGEVPRSAGTQGRRRGSSMEGKRARSSRSPIFLSLSLSLLCSSSESYISVEGTGEKRGRGWQGKGEEGAILTIL